MDEIQNILQQKEELKAFCSTIGNLSGRVGSVVVRLYPRRDKNGRIKYQQRFATIPAHYKVNNRKDLVANRSRFRVNNIFSSFINGIPELKEIWKKYSERNGFSSAYSAITKENSPYTGKTTPGEMNIIIPPAKSCLPFNKSDIIFSKGSIRISNLSKGMLIAVISLIEPKSVKSEKFKLFMFKSEIEENEGADITLPEGFSGELNNYKRFILYFTVVNGNKISSYSSVNGRIKYNIIKNKILAVIPAVDIIHLYSLDFNKWKKVVAHSPPMIRAA
jgi:hypothetical protein